MVCLEKTLENFQKNGFGAKYFPHKDTAAQWLAQQLSPGQLAAFGGSETIKEIGLAERLENMGVELLDFWNVPADQRRAAFIRSLDADAYFCSANAVTEEGHYFNVDGMGNRTASTIYGPHKLFIVAGINKLVKNQEEAFARAEIAGPKNCRRMGTKAPCTADGKCHDCSSPDRACRVYVLTKRPARTVDTTIVLIGEELGY